MKSLEYTFQTHFGSQDRGNGEPYFHEKNLFMVVEGVGGNYLADIAREHAYRIIPETFFKKLSEYNSPGDAIVDALVAANKAIITERSKLGEKMAASISVVFMRDDIMYFTHLGDSRIYSYQGRELNQLTKDHTLKEEDPFAESRLADPRALRALTQGLGILKDPSVEVKKYPLHKKGLILMTTDGLTERVSNREILWSLKKIKNPEKLTKSLIDLARRKGSEGSITVGIVKFGGLTKALRNLLVMYSAFFLIVLAVIGGYLMEYGEKESKVDQNEAASTMQERAMKQPKPMTVEEKIGSPETKTEKEKPSVVKEIIQKGPESIEISKKNSAELFEIIHRFITEWKTAWENTAGEKGDMEKYISFYSEKFRENRLDKKGWKLDKAKKGIGKQWIRIELSDIKISELTDDKRIKVTFTQDYRSSNFSVRSEKLLILEKEASGWKIIHERSS